MNLLPPPRIHYESLRRSQLHGELFAHLRRNREAVLRDATGEEVLGYDFSRTHSVTYNALRASLLYLEHGQQVAVVGPRMQASFEDTDLSRVHPDDLRLPYPCFYLATPGSEQVLWGGSDTRWHRVDGAYVYLDPSNPDRLCVLVWAGPNERSRNEHDDAIFWFSVNLARLRGGATFEAALDPVGEEVHGSIFNINREAEIGRMRSDVGFEAAIEALLADPSNEQSDAGARGYAAEDAEIQVRLVASLRKLFRVIVCTCLYLTSPRADRESAPDRDAERDALSREIRRLRKKKHPEAGRLQKKLDEIPAYRTVWVGPGVESAAGAATDLTRAGREARTERAGYYRRGHMHPYLTGPRKASDGATIPSSERSRVYHWNPGIWVAGATDRPDPESLPHIYAVREPESEPA